MINDDPIKESCWETINATILSHAEIKIFAISNGSHNSGTDILSSLGNLSNKSSKYMTKATMTLTLVHI